MIKLASIAHDTARALRPHLRAAAVSVAAGRDRALAVAHDLPDRIHDFAQPRPGAVDLTDRVAVEAERVVVAAHQLEDEELAGQVRRAVAACAYVAAARALLAAPNPAGGHIVELPVYDRFDDAAYGINRWDRSTPIRVIAFDERVELNGTYTVDGEVRQHTYTLSAIESHALLAGAARSLTVPARKFTSKAAYRRELTAIIDENQNIVTELQVLGLHLLNSTCPCCLAERKTVLGEVIGQLGRTCNPVG